MNEDVQLVFDVIRHPLVPVITKDAIMRVIRMNTDGTGTTITPAQRTWFKKLLIDYEQRQQVQNIRQSI